MNKLQNSNSRHFAVYPRIFKNCFHNASAHESLRIVFTTPPQAEGRGPASENNFLKIIIHRKFHRMRELIDLGCRLFISLDQLLQKSLREDAAGS